MKVLFIIFSLFSFILPTHVGNPKGTYNSTEKTRDGESDGYIKLDEKGTFVYANWGGCSLYCEIRGDWRLSGDTLIMSGRKRRCPKKSAWEKLNSQSKYLLKNDSLISFHLWNGEPLYNRYDSYTKNIKK